VPAAKVEWVPVAYFCKELAMITRLFSLLTLSFFAIILSSGCIIPECSHAQTQGSAWGSPAPASPPGPSSKEKSHELEEILVVAPPVIEGNQINRFGAESTVVSEKQIEDLNAQDLPQALRMVPGVVISRFNPIGSFGGGEGGSIFIRGMGSSRPGAEVLTLIDGIPKFVSVWTHPLMDVLNVDIAQNIQVYKGAQPVLYGNMAVAGAVDITTKRKTEDGFTTSLEGAGGSFNSAIEVAQTGGKIRALDYYLVQSYRRADGHRPNADGELQNYFGHLGYQLSGNWTAGVVFNASDNWADDPGRIDGLAPQQGTFKTNDYFTVATLANQYDRTDGYFKLYSDVGHIKWLNQFNTTTKKNTDDTLTDYNNYGFRARQTVRPWDGGEFLMGVDLDTISGQVDLVSPSTPRRHWNDEAWHIFAPYVALSQLFGSKDSFYAIPSAGARYFSHDQFGTELGPQAGLILGYKDTEFHAFCSRGVNYPGLFVKANSDLFMPGDNKWQNLNAEVVNHYEAGISQRFKKWAKLDFTLFYDNGKDRIVTTTPPPFPPVWTNISSYRNKGVEGTVTVFPLDDLALYAGATYLDSTPSDLPYAPEWSASFGVNYRFLKYFQASFDALYLSEYFVNSRARSATALNVDTVDGYFLLNAKLTYDFNIPYRQMRGQIFIAGENLTNASYQQKAGYPMPGINGMGGFKLTF
jgi:outer membrane receptor protein involved in Fe transport